MSSSTRRNNNDYSTSPEFEFCRILQNPSFPQPNVLSADQLFLHGVILPLHLLPTQTKPDPLHKPDSTTTTTTTPCKHIFTKNAQQKVNKKNKKEKRFGYGGGGCGSVSASAELNINIWPFSRSSSAGNSTTRPKSSTGAPVTRKINSAPCSRSNSTGDSKSRKWPSSPCRAGVHLGRSSPVWQVRRGSSGAAKNTEPLPMSRRSRFASTVTGGGSIGYSENCRMEENSGSNGGGKLFNLRTFFTKKTVLTSH